MPPGLGFKNSILLLKPDPRGIDLGLPKKRSLMERPDLGWDVEWAVDWDVEWMFNGC